MLLPSTVPTGATLPTTTHLGATPTKGSTLPRTYHAHQKYVNYHAPQAHGSYFQSMKYTSAKQISATIAAYHSNWSRGVAAPIDVNRDRSYNFPEVIGYKDEIFSSVKRKEKVKEVTPQPQLWTVQKFQKIQGSEEKG